MSDTLMMQPPSGGCSNCGGPVRTYKTGNGWMCAECVREQDRRPAKPVIAG